MIMQAMTKRGRGERKTSDNVSNQPITHHDTNTALSDNASDWTIGIRCTMEGRTKRNSGTHCQHGNDHDTRKGRGGTNDSTANETRRNQEKAAHEMNQHR